MKLRLGIAALLAALLFGVRAQAVVGPGMNAGSPSINVHDGRISADVDAPLDKVLAAIARASGLEIRVHGAADRQTRLVFRDIPLEVALRRLLGATSSAFVYAPPQSDRTSLPILVAVHVYTSGTAPSAAVASAASSTATAATTTPGTEDDDPAQILLESRSWVARKKAVQKLATTAGDGAVDALGRAVSDDEDPWVREKAALALGRTPSEKAVAPLSDALLRDQDPFVREAAATSLGKSRSDTAVATLAYALRGDPGVEVREAAAAALGRTRSETAVATLAEAAERDESERVRARAQAALHSIRGRHETPADGSPD
ncbi:MAG TPA: HEAT repeat domain-containing protein [Candidatus Binatia bacterium]|nr:HEAT repeat domain-containing protein [Candidatus Binatia bacterium]